MKIGSRVIVTDRTCSFFGQSGRVTQVTPHMMVHLDDERLPLRFGVSEVAEEPESVPMTGAE